MASLKSDLRPIKAPNEPDIRDVIAFEREYRARPEVQAAAEKKVTPKQVDSALDKTPTPQTTTPSGAGGEAGGGGQREIQCPFCHGEVLPKRQGRLFQRLPGWLQRSFPIKFVSTLYDYLIELIPSDKYSVLNSDCEVCRNKRTIPDPTDDSEKWSAVKSNFEAAAPEIEREEARLAPAGGNRYTVIQGCDLLEVGLGMNDVESYRVDKDCMVCNGRLTDLGTKEIDPKKGGPIPKGARMNHIQGTNPPSSPGGHYIIKCSNKFSLVTGAQGVDITTGGPITINGGITQITGPEITIGSQTGRLALEGQVVSVGGKSIEMAPTAGQVFVKGTIGTTGNIECGGHAHLESASVIKLETTGKNQESNISSPNNVYGGPAFWGGPITEGIKAGLKELKSYVLFNTTNPEHAKYVASLRYILGLGDNLENVNYLLRPRELVPTGVCIVKYGSSAGEHEIFNYPHIHALPDGMHTHETRVPDIKCDADDAPSVRGSYAGTAGPAPLHVEGKSAIEALKALWEVISLVFVGVASTIQHFTYRK